MFFQKNFLEKKVFFRNSQKNGRFSTYFDYITSKGFEHRNDLNIIYFYFSIREPNTYEYSLIVSTKRFRIKIPHAISPYIITITKDMCDSILD